MAVSTAIKARKKSTKYFPCGVATPGRSITGKCQNPHKRPGTTPGFIIFCFKLILGKAKPVHPISSKNPAGIPSRKPTGKKLGLKTGDIKLLRKNRTRFIKQGEM